MTAQAELNPFQPPQAQVEDAQQGGVDTEFKLNIFSAEGRIGRIRYLGYNMGFGILVMFVAGVLGGLVSPVLLFIAYPALIYFQIMLAIKRSHDFDTTGWLSLLIFVPLINLVFLFIPGTNGPNRFGNKTAPNGKAGVIVILVLVGIALIGILAAIAIPAYSGYQQAKTMQMRCPPCGCPPSGFPPPDWRTAAGFHPRINAGKTSPAPHPAAWRHGCPAPPPT